MTKSVKMEQTKTSPRVSDSLGLYRKVDDICRTYSNVSYVEKCGILKKNSTSMVITTKVVFAKNEKTVSIVAEREGLSTFKTRKSESKSTKDAGATTKTMAGLEKRETKEILSSNSMASLSKGSTKCARSRIIAAPFATFTNLKPQKAPCMSTIATKQKRLEPFFVIAAI